MHKEFSSINYYKIISIVVLLFLAWVIISFVSRNVIISNASPEEDEIWQERFQSMPTKTKYKIAIIAPGAENLGLHMLAKRLDIAAKNIGWESYVFENYTNENVAKIKEANPDFVISTLLDHEFSGDSLPYKIYAYFTQSTKTYFGGVFSLFPQFKENKYNSINRIDGFLCSFKAVGLLKKLKEKQGGEFYGFRTFPLTHKTEFEPLNYNSIVYFGTNWDKVRSSNRFKLFFKKLQDNGILNVYGTKQTWDYLDDSWRGIVDGDGWQVIDITKQHGISLIIHAKRYNKEGIPSSRIFEAIAASSIVIADKNEFIMKNFQDNVLYLNEEKSANAMTDEIIAHVNWIRENPELAKEKAKNAHAILQEKFILENELVQIAKMHEYIILKKNN